MLNSTLNLKNTEDDQLRVVIIPIENGILSIRGLSPKRLRFELEYGLERGTTDNSFLFTESDNSKSNLNSYVLVHPPGAIYAKVFIQALGDALPNNFNKLKIIVGHVNPNRIDMIRQLAQIYSKIELISSNPGAKLIRELWDQKRPITDKDIDISKNQRIALPPIQIIRQETKLSLNNSHTLHLIPAPTAKWPGGLIAFEESQGLLMSDKLFAAHCCISDWSEAYRISTEEERRHFYDCLMAPMADQINALLERLYELDIQTIAPVHGPAIEASWRSLFNDYRRWGEEKQQSKLNVALLFASAYGNTASIADALSTGVSLTGIRVKSLNCEFSKADELLETIKDADAYLIGSPTLGGHAPTPIVSALGTLLSEGDRNKPVGVFGSYGWSGEAIDLLENKLRNGGFKFGFKTIKIKFSPSSSKIKTIQEIGVCFGRELLQKKKQQQRRSAGGLNESRSNPEILALGRIIGSLCILTIRKGKNHECMSGAMVASWVSQASFSPPGLTIAIAKDRAVGALLNRHDHFTLNILAAGRHNNLMKQFLQPFPPGADRFKGVKTESSPTGQPILPESLAWLEACVQQRMECGDHWLIYAEVSCGGVLDQEGTTAVHHRRTGANY